MEMLQVVPQPLFPWIHGGISQEEDWVKHPDLFPAFWVAAEGDAVFMEEKTKEYFLEKFLHQGMFSRLLAGHNPSGAC